jgi:hypothetical protein
MSPVSQFSSRSRSQSPPQSPLLAPRDVGADGVALPPLALQGTLLSIQLQEAVPVSVCVSASVCVSGDQPPQASPLARLPRRQLLPLSDVLGISFELSSDMLRDEVNGRVVVVMKKKMYPTRYWRQWLGVLAKLTASFCSAWYMLGPLSAAALFTPLAALVRFSTRSARRTRDSGSPMLRRSRSAGVGVGRGAKGDDSAMAHVSLPRVFSAVISGVLVAAALFWALTALAAAALSLAASEAALSVPPAPCLYCVLALYAALYAHSQTSAAAMRVYQALVHPMALPLPPFYHVPIVIQYEEHQLQQLITLRAQFYKSETLRPYVWRYWVGNPAVESVLSFCLPSTPYNSKRFRQFLFIALNYAVPLYSMVRGVGALLPFLETAAARLAAPLRADAGLAALRALLAERGRRPWAALPRYLAASLAARAHAQPAVRSVLQLASYLNSILFHYLIPNNIYLQYVQSQLVLLQVCWHINSIFY